MKTILAYCYDGKFGCFTGKVVPIEADYTIDGKTIYALPKNSTAVEPPDWLDEHQVAVFFERTRTWLIVSDHRGEVWYDWKDQPQVIDRPGNPEEWNPPLRKEPRIAA